MVGSAVREGTKRRFTHAASSPSLKDAQAESGISKGEVTISQPDARAQASGVVADGDVWPARRSQAENGCEMRLG